jgi:hypothetical protein
MVVTIALIMVVITVVVITVLVRGLVVAVARAPERRDHQR